MNNLGSYKNLFLFCLKVISILVLVTPPVLHGAEIKGKLESPFEGSFESGIGLIRGWVCNATKVEVQINDNQKLITGYGTRRDDTANVCGDTNNGFGIVYNWNELGTGKHKITVFADGIAFVSVQFKVTSLTSNYLTGVSGDYPANLNTGTTTIPIILHWSEPHQNFVIIRDTRSSPQYSNTVSTINAGLESPFEGSFESGIGLIRGWVCNANKVEIQIDGGERWLTAYGTTRRDTNQVCGDINNGFGLVYNWNQVGNGMHNLRAYADNIEFANVYFQVTTLGKDYLQLNVGGDISNFPYTGDITTIQWSNPHQNFVISNFQDNSSSPSSPKPSQTIKDYCDYMWVECGIYCGFYTNSAPCRSDCLQKYSICLSEGYWP